MLVQGQARGLLTGQASSLRTGQARGLASRVFTYWRPDALLVVGQARGLLTVQASSLRMGQARVMTNSDWQRTRGDEDSHESVRVAVSPGLPGLKEQSVEEMYYGVARPVLPGLRPSY